MNPADVLEKVEFADGTVRTFEDFWGLDKSGTEQGAGSTGGSGGSDPIGGVEVVE